MFDAGVNWIRIGQYENSSEPTSWDWVERRRGVYAISPEVDDYVNSLADNGVNIQVQLLYGNAMYTSPSGKKPDESTPEPGSFHNSDRSLYSVFWPPKTPDQIDAFNRYAKWMVGHFRGRIRHFALWNEQDINYWNPYGNAEEYGRLLKAFVPAIHEADPQAKVIYGGQADPVRDFAQRALDTCQCAAGIDIFAYHTYPGYGQNRNPETMDYGAYGAESPAKLRDLVRNYPGIRKDMPFWDDEFNSIPSWTGSDESVQAKYIPRGMIYNWAAGVKTFVWLLAAGVDGNEYDDFGLIHGFRNLPDDFTPRPVFHAFRNTIALFSDTKPDAAIHIDAGDISGLARNARAPFLAYGFRSRSGKAIVAYWAAAHSVPGDIFATIYGDIKISGTGIRHPVLIDVVSGKITRAQWKPGTTDVLPNAPVRDSIFAIADEDYFDWPVLPETPSGLVANRSGAAVQLRWEMHGGDATGAHIERRSGNSAPWTALATANSATYADRTAPVGIVCYRAAAVNGSGRSAWSNYACVGR